MSPHPDMKPEHSALGKKTSYEAHYNPDLLFPISRKEKRAEIGIPEGETAFYGEDLWNHYEVSWLNPKGKPVVALAEIRYDCHTPCLIESKSMKLYFNSLNNTVFESTEALTAILEKDLAEKTGGTANVILRPLDGSSSEPVFFSGLDGTLLDVQDIEFSHYEVDSTLLTTDNIPVSETLTSHLLKSNCLVTGQPDWGSIAIEYKGHRIHHEGLLRYIVSFRNHNEFHEQCIERIFMDIMTRCRPDKLTVYGRYTRRGGLDINPYRSSAPLGEPIDNRRLIRQ